MPIRSRSLVVASVLAGTLLAACGGGDGGGDGVATLDASESGEAADSSTDTTLSDAEIEEALLDWVACMREQGVDIADPTVDADGNLVLGGGPGGGGAGTDDGEDDGTPPDRAAMEAAAEVCGDPPQGAFGGGAFDEADREAFQESALQLAECMREQGIEDFPDPDFSAGGPGAGPPEDGDDGGQPGGPFGDVDFSDPEVQAAMDTCQQQLADAGVELPGGGAGGRGAAGDDDTGTDG